MKNIEIYKDNKWYKGNINFLELGINITELKKSKIIPYTDIKSISKFNETLKITYSKKIDIEKKDMEIIIKTDNETMHKFEKKFTIKEEKREKVMKENTTEINNEKNESSTLNLFKIVCLILCILFIIFSININKDNKILGVYVTGNKFVSYLLSLFFGFLFILLQYLNKKNNY